MEETLDALAKNWWALFLRGLVAILFSIAAFARPGPTLAMLVVLFGAYAIGDGIAALIGAARAGQRQQAWLLMAIEGSLGVVLGLFALTMPGKALTVAFLLLAIWALATGVLELVESSALRRQLSGGWLLVASGFLRIALGLILITRPGRGAVALLMLAATYALIDGIVFIVLSFKLRGHAVERHAVSPRGPSPQPT